MRLDAPKSTILVFSTGKAVITGLRNEEDVGTSAKKVTDILRRAKIDISGTPEFAVQNIVASGDLHVPVDLNEAAIMMDNAIYEPEVFPGLIFRMAEPRCVFLIFSTGRVVCTGAKTKEIVKKAIETLSDLVVKLELVGNLGRATINDDVA
jgi:transcription initiation factor TFIID TATA-box-binding protein